jgi:Zn-dependent peptidase ImmA (M78 family)
MIERLREPGRPLHGLRIAVCPDNELPEDEAIAYVDERIIKVRQSVHDGARNGQPRCNMTIAHEVGHIALDHRGAPKSRKPGASGRENFIPAGNSVERQATVFGATLLMPRAQVRQCESAAEVAQRLNVSLQAARIRFERVNVRDADKKTPPDIAAAIEKLKADASAGYKRRVPDSVLSPEQQAKLAWETADVYPEHDPHEYRCIEGSWVIRWSRWLKQLPGGWRIANRRIIPWESECR